MKQGKTVRRRRWLKEGCTVVSAHLAPKSDENDAFVAWVGPDGKWDPMTYSHTNVLAEDWEIIES